MPQDEISTALAGIPILAGVPRDRIRVLPLGGLSSTNLKLETPVGNFVLQIPIAGPYTPNRRQAIDATRRASQLGIGAELIHAEPTTGILVTRWIDGSEVLSPRRLGRDGRLLGDVAGLLRRWHRSGERLNPAIDCFGAIDRFRAALAVPAVSAQLDDTLRRAKAELGTPTHVAPVHGDPVLENFLQTPDGLVLIDWEYAGMGDPAWDLAYLALAADMTPSEEAALLAAYGAPDIILRRLHLYRMAAAVLSALWFMMRMRGETPPDLSDWIDTRLQQAEELSTALYPIRGSG